ncbi:hypothetical protein SH1V18_33210 [Vallitalea longa]|uniref:NodB homology domain-containing protein n=1 Tax=Vallitalea longa TaxID=2936439 RepID=A0A9W6DF41_9FIRM|nr:polysaccharide deacetylase family protein [Vallitalea longa]GKX30841.1 hypothetical protein SH1V18_33210 [Vallitalea longa]
MNCNRVKFSKEVKLIILVTVITLLFTSCSFQIIDEDKNNIEKTDRSNPEIDIKQDGEKIESDSENNQSNEDNKKSVDSNDNESNDIDNEKPIQIDYQTVKPNEIGHIIVVMYHGIKDIPPYHITEEQFTEQLQFMYDHGYRPISMRDYIDNNIDIEAGCTPIVLTFDDGLKSTFSLIEENGDLVPKTGTAIEILERFSKEHPGFDSKAALYINGTAIFEGAGTVEERLNWLVDHGYDIGNHTATHVKLNKISSREIMSEIGIVDQLIKNAIPEYKVDSFSYPFGIRPVKALRNLVAKGEYKEIEYNYVIGLREGPSGPYYSPLHVKFNSLNVARARGSKGEVQDLWWFLEDYEKHPERKYISDGNPNRISILEKDEEHVNKDKLGDKELYLYKLNQ